PSDREHTTLFQYIPAMREASRPDEILSLACEEMILLGKAELNASPEQDAERGRLLAHAPRGPLFSSGIRAPLDFDRGGCTQSTRVFQEVTKEPASMRGAIHRGIP